MQPESNLYKYAARMKVCTNMQPEWKFAKNMQPESKMSCCDH